MYVPSLFAEDRPEELQAIMRNSSLPVLVSQVKDGDAVRMMATHLPLMLEGQCLVGHIARANKQWQLLDSTAESLAIFSGVDGYVSPSYYATKQETRQGRTHLELRGRPRLRPFGGRSRSGRDLESRDPLDR